MTLSKIPKCALDLIKQFEGCRLSAYPDPASGGDPWTIGWGTTRYKDGLEVKPGDKITQERADSELLYSLESVYLPPLTKIPHFGEMSQEQVGALLSFAYNLGATFYGSPDFTTISRYLRSKDWGRVPEALLLYRNPGSNVEEGLRRRRVAEGELWSKGLSEFKAAKRLMVAKQDTLLKKEPLQSFELGTNSRVEVPRGRSYTVIHSTVEGSHTRVTLDSGAGTWYVYTPHWEFQVPGSTQATSDSKVILLNAPYYTQLDSTTSHAARMCFSSTCAMAAEFLKPGCLGGNRGADDRYLNQYVFKHGDTTNPVAQVRALADLGLVANYRQNLNRESVLSQLRKNIPVPVGYLHKGPVGAPTGGGHWALIVGVDLNREAYIVHDPWGECDLVGGGMMGMQNGANLRYSFKNFEPRWMVEGNGTGWGLLLVR